MKFVTEVLTYAPMAKEKLEMLTARQFAKRAGVAYPTVMKWLKENLIPGAEMKESAQFGPYWDIPATSLNSVTKRKPGPKKGSKRAQIQAADSNGAEAADDQADEAESKPKRRDSNRTAAKKALKKMAKKAKGN